MEQFRWADKQRKIDAAIDEITRLKEKERHARYYKEHRSERLKKQRQADRIRDRKTPSKEYYEKNKEAIAEKSKIRYEANKEERRRKAREYYYKHRDEINERRGKLRDAKRRRESESAIRQSQTA